MFRSLFSWIMLGDLNPVESCPWHPEFRSLFSWIMLGDEHAMPSSKLSLGFDPCSPGSCWATA